MAVCQSGHPIPDSTFYSRFIESVKIMASVMCHVKGWPLYCV